MSTRSLLISFPKYYPREIFNLVPDNGLANLAASLISQGHFTQILDYSTIDSIQRFFPHGYAGELEKLLHPLAKKVRSDTAIAPEELKDYYYLEDEIHRWQQNQARILGRELAEHVGKNKIDFVGFKLWTGEGFEASIAIAEELKKTNPSLKLFAGGPHVDSFMEMVPETTDVFDVVAYGEGEETIIKLAEYIEGKARLAEIPNIMYKNNGALVRTREKRIEDLGRIPLAVYDSSVYPAMNDDRKIKIFLIDESRGCPNSCNFCIHPVKSGRKRRAISPELFVDRIEEIGLKYGMHAFRLAGSNPPVNLRSQAAQEMIERKLRVRYSAFAHVRGAKTEDFKILRRSGCCALAFGVESGSQQILSRVMNKNVTVAQIEKALTASKEAGIATIASFIVPAPMETDATKKETLEMIVRTSPDNVNVFFPTMMKGSKWDTNSSDFGFEIRDKDRFYKKAMFFKGNLRLPRLWRPLSDYRLDGKTFAEIADETYQFIKLVEKRGISTQVYDMVFLIAEYAEMSAPELRDRSNSLISEGNHEKLQRIVERVNRNVLTCSSLQTEQVK